MSRPPSIPPEQRLPMLHKMIDDLPPEELEVVEQVLARLEMNRLWNGLREGMEEDWNAGKFAKLDEVIREVREALRSDFPGFSARRQV